MAVKKFVVDKLSSNFTTFPNHVLQLLTNVECLGLYVYLASLPQDWEFYKNQLCDHFKLGTRKLDNLLKKLAQHDLVRIAQMRDAQGQFAHFSLTVMDGLSFKINVLEKSKDENAHRSSKTVPTVTDGRLRQATNNIYTNNNNKKTNTKSSCASGDARTSDDDEPFNRFWKIYPRKKDKRRAWVVWCEKKLTEKADYIIDRLGKQVLADKQWLDKQFIPYPETYLRWERWEDEIDDQSPSTGKKESGVERALRMCKMN
jgi:hypothetical protein